SQPPKIRPPYPALEEPQADSKPDSVRKRPRQRKPPLPERAHQHGAHRRMGRRDRHDNDEKRTPVLKGIKRLRQNSTSAEDQQRCGESQRERSLLACHKSELSPLVEQGHHGLAHEQQANRRWDTEPEGHAEPRGHLPTKTLPVLFRRPLR